MMDEITDICQGMLTTTAHTHIFAQGHGRIFDSNINTEEWGKNYEKISSIFRNSKKKHIKNYN